MSYLEIRNLRKTYGCGARRTAVLENFSLSVAEGEFVAVVGRHGDGKTTLASLIAGLTLPDYGTMTLAGRCVTGPGPDRGLMSQSYQPHVWLNLFDNVLNSLDSQSLAPAERRRRVEHLLQLVRLDHFAEQKPAELLEPQRRRLALARTLAANPDVLLLDDPLAGLADAARDEFAADLERVVAGERKTCILFTSNVDEALALADRVVPLLPDTRALAVKEILIDVPHPRKAPRRNPRLEQLRAAVVNSLAAVTSVAPTFG